MFNKNFKESCMLYLRDFAEYNPYILLTPIIPTATIDLVIYTDKPRDIFNKILKDFKENQISLKYDVSRKKDYIYYWISFVDFYYTKQQVNITVTNESKEKRNKNKIVNKEEFYNSI